MGKFRLISTELLPLIYVEKWFCALSWLFGMMHACRAFI